MKKPFFTYDTEADALYVLLVEESEAAIDRTEELAPTLHVDLHTDGTIVGVEFLYPRTHGVDVASLKERYGIDLEVPFRFAA